MGNTCGCASILQIQSPRPLEPSNRTARTTQLSIRTQPKFTDIVPQQNQPMELTQLNLNLLNQELQTFLLQYEQLNGEISKKFTKRSLKCQSVDVVKFNSSESFEQKQTQQVAKPVAENQLYLPLSNQNIDIQLEEPSINSKDNTQKHSSTITSCLLTQQSHILNDSLFTDRCQLKKEFYSKYNSMGNTELMQWKDAHRLSYQLYIDEFLELRETSTNQKLIVCLESIYQYWKNLEINLLSYSLHPYGLKVHVNGLKRCFPINPGSISQPCLSTINQQLISKIKKYNPSDMIFILTGWIPEYINIGDIKNFNGIFERLANNLQEGNSLITFTRMTQNSQEYVCLSKIDLQNQLLYLNSAGTKTTIPDILFQQNSDISNNEAVLNFQNFVEMFDMINLNWNPSIYEVAISRQGLIRAGERSINKYRLIIPPCSQDIEIRLFLQKHHNFNGEVKQSNIQISLFESEGTGQVSESQSIRQLQTTQLIYSDVFIFESCKEKTQYLLTVAVEGEQSPSQDIYLTLTLFSFVELNFEQLKSKSILKQKSIIASITPQNAGYGINSPYFNKNLQFIIDVQKQKQLIITLLTSNNFSYQICLIPDPEKQQNLIKLSLENIINNSIISSQKKGVGSFCINTQFSNYLLIINAYSQVTDNIEIKLGLYGNTTQHFAQSTLNIKQYGQIQNIAFVQDIRWLPHHYGPRKRLKSNSVTTYQPLQTFSQFFKNPLIDKFMNKGKYQFFVKSQTFKDYFQSVEGYEDKNQCQPPALSMAIFQTTEDKQQFKIILDDAFYVPFGVGFWSGQIELQQGLYRFVFPKIEKDFSKGTFGIIIC